MTPRPGHYNKRPPMMPPPVPMVPGSQNTYSSASAAASRSSALEQASDANNAWFVDLFVRASNHIAKELYRKMGYSVYRTVRDYYNDGEDALDMRKPCSRDEKRECVRENGEGYVVDPGDVW